MITKELENTLNLAVAEATTRQHEYVTLEHLLLALLNDPTARDVIYHCGGNVDSLRKDIEEFFAAHSEMVNPDSSTLPEQTIAFQRVLQYALLQAQASEQQEVNGGGVLAALFHARHSHAVFLLSKQGITRLAVLNYISHGISAIGEEQPTGNVNVDEGEEEARASRDPSSSVLLASRSHDADTRDRITVLRYWSKIETAKDWCWKNRATARTPESALTEQRSRSDGYSSTPNVEPSAFLRKPSQGLT